MPSADIGNKYDFLSGTVRVLVIENDKKALAAYKEIMSLCHLYRVDFAATITEAESLIKKNGYHVCLMDIGMQTSVYDELYLLKKFGKILSFLIVSAQRSLSTGCMIGRLGGKVLLKSAALGKPELMLEINNQFLRYLISPLACNLADDYQLWQCQSVLINENPKSVSEWGYTAGIPERYLREKWFGRVGCKPRHSLFLYNVFTDAFAAVVENVYGYSVGRRFDEGTYIRRKKHYEKNRVELNSVLDRFVEFRMPGEDELSLLYFGASNSPESTRGVWL
ncbi:MAG: response regulator [Chitinivibrionales bacterium]|nr:response regulator [Chitinivibrionales bacterium]MBD3355984.1 response regulator [Chitinivibrionales bacterium]